MPTASIHVDYNRDLHALAETLAAVKRSGNFCTVGSLEAPMPRLDDISGKLLGSRRSANV